MIDTDPVNPVPGESVVDEVRAIREAIDEEVGHDVRRLGEQVRRNSEAIRREFGLRVAKLPPRNSTKRN